MIKRYYTGYEVQHFPKRGPSATHIPIRCSNLHIRILPRGLSDVSLCVVQNVHVLTKISYLIYFLFFKTQK